MDDLNAQPECEPPEKKQKLETKSDNDSDRCCSPTSDDETSSDGGLHTLGLHPMTREEKRRYRKQVAESQGFDIDDFSACSALALIVPVRSSLKFEVLKTFSNLAIDHYNNETQDAKQMELVRVVKANCRITSHIDYYITFEAKEKDAADAETKTFQAYVTITIPALEIADSESTTPETKVEFCRLKPTH